MPDRPADVAQPGEPPRGGASAPITQRTHVVHNLRVPMRDGVELALDVLRPDLAGPFPTVLVRTPYDKTATRVRTPLAEQLAQRGFAVAFNDCRGRFNSGGVFQPYFDEANDGFDTVEWIAAQDWCDGNVGMLGGSYVGQTQWYAASQQPPHLKAIVPICSPPSTLWRNEPLFGGCFMLAHAEWMVRLGERTWQIADAADPLAEQKDYLDALPIADMPGRAGVTSPWWDEMTEHPTFDGYWRRGSYDHGAMNVAALNITGWWDMNFPGAPLNFQAMNSRPVAAGQKLVIGPWPHAVNIERQLSGIDFGEHALIDYYDYVVRFFERRLKGAPNGVDGEKPVHIFVIGANEWWAEDAWPLPDAVETSFYFHSRGHANSLNGDGVLSLESPDAEPPDVYRYDPSSPTRIVWDVAGGPVDDRIATMRNDCLCYTSETLTEPIDVVGWVTCRIFASSSAPDTDWYARLVDVHPDGSARFLCQGALRARFRESFEHPTFLKPDEPTLFEFTMDACGVRFLPEHRVRIEIASSWFMQYARNTNTGTANFFRESTTAVATQRIYHQTGLASCVRLPVVPQRR